MEKGRGGKQEGAQKGDDGLGSDDDDNEDAESEANIAERKID